jgi:hypothetical protein
LNVALLHTGLPFTLDVELEDNGIVVCYQAARFTILALLEPAQKAYAFAIALERNKSESLREDLILDYGGVVGDVDVFDGEGGYFGD